MKTLLTVFVFALTAHAQIFGPPVRFREVYHSPGAGQSAFPTGVSAGYTVIVIDGNSAGPCTTGGGTTVSQCRYNGSVWVAVGPASAGGGDAQTANPLSQFASTSSSQLRGVLSDETGTGAAVFGTSPTIDGLVGTGAVSFGGTTGLLLRFGTTAPSSADCDSSGERGAVYVQSGDPATVATRLLICTQTGASSYAWMPSSHKVGATDPATCAEGDLFYNTTSDTLRACTATDTWGAIGGSGGGDASTNTSSSVDSEVALFSSTGGKTLKRATATGVAKLTSGVLGTVSGTSTNCVLVDGTSAACGGSGGTAATRAESETGTNNTAMTTPLAATYSVASAGGCGVIMSSQTLTVFPGATTAHPCNIEVNNVTRRFTAPATVVLGSGSVSVNASEALFYIKPNGTIYVGLPSAFTVASMTFSGITAEQPITDWPAGSTKVWKWLAGTTDNFWDTSGGDGNGGSNFISLRSRSSLLAGAGVTITENSDGEETIGADSIMATDEEVATNANTYAVISGTTTLTLTTSSPASPNANGVCVLGKMGASNSSGTVTLAVNGATARNVYKLNGSSDASQVGSELRANTIYQFCYDTSLGSQVWLVNPGGGSGGASPLTTKGDVYTYSTADARLGVGSNGQTFIADSAATTGNKWAYVVKEETFPAALCGGSYASGWAYINGSEPAGTGACGSGYTSGMPQQPYLSFLDSANKYAVFNWKLPSTFVALVSVTYHIAPGGASGGNYALRYGAMCFGASDDWLTGTPSFTDDSIFTAAPGSTSFVESAASHSTTNVDSCSATGARVAMKIGREGTDGADTNTNDLFLFGITIKYTARAE